MLLLPLDERRLELALARPELLLDMRLLPLELRLPPLRALARSLWAPLLRLLPFPPWLAACARLPRDDDEDEREDEEEELRDAIACS